TNNTAFDGTPAWSPNAKKLAFTSKRGGTNRVYTMTADGHHQKPLTPDGVNVYAPAWSPSGKHLTYEDHSNAESEIARINADGSHPKVLTDNALGDYFRD